MEEKTNLLLLELLCVMHRLSLSLSLRLHLHLHRIVNAHLDPIAAGQKLTCCC